MSVSKWSKLQDVDAIDIAKFSGNISTKINIPSSKSYTNRYLLAAAFADGTSNIDNFLMSDDSYWCQKTIEQMGAHVHISDNVAKINGTNLNYQDDETLYVGSAGTTGRFLTAMLAMATKRNVIIDASAQLKDRPFKELFLALEQLNADITYLDKKYHLPVRLAKGKAVGGDIEISGKTSSQFISALLMAAPLATKPVRIAVTSDIVQQDYVKITIDVLAQFGISVQINDNFNEFYITPQTYQSTDINVEADASSASYFFALAALFGNDIHITNFQRNSLQPDSKFIDILVKMGATIEQPPSGGIRLIAPKQLMGGFDIDMQPCSDTALTLASLAPFASEAIKIYNIEHIRHHECDRITAMSKSLAALGVPVQEHNDGWTIYPKIPQYTVLETFDDHRMAMSLAILAAGGNGGKLLQPNCVAKTFPNFFEMLNKLGISNKPIL